MKNDKLSRFKMSFAFRLGLSEIPVDSQKFIFTHFNFLLFTTIPGVFINTFFFRQDGRISTVAIYNAVSLLGIALVMHISSQISLKKTPAFILRIGVAFFNIFYIVLLLLQNNAAKYMLLLGVLNALAGGFYWQGYNEMVKLCTNDNTFDRTVSLIGLSNAVVTLVIPMLSGILITTCTGQLGYRIIFLISFLCSVYTTYLTTKLKNDKIVGKSNLPGVYRYIFTHRDAFVVNLGDLMRGIKNAAFPLFLNIIFFKFVSNEAALGVNNMLCGAASILSFIIAGRIVRPGNRLKYILTFSLISFVLFLPLFFIMNSALIFVLAIANAFVCAFIDNPSVGILYSTFEKPIDGITFSQIMSVHEIFFAVGRCIGLSLLILLSGSSLSLAIFAVLLNLSTVITWALFHLRKDVAVK